MSIAAHSRRSDEVPLSSKERPQGRRPAASLQQGGVSWRSLAPRGSPELVRRAPELIRSPPNWSLTAPKLVLNGLFFSGFF